MINCPNCGAANRPGSQVCRMCATKLAQQEASVSRTPADFVSESKSKPEETVETQGIACPSCNTVNEVGWSFCQQCGGRLPQAPAAPEWKPQADYKTTASPVADFIAPATVVAEPPVNPVQPTDSGAAPTVVVEAPSKPAVRSSGERVPPPPAAPSQAPPVPVFNAPPPEPKVAPPPPAPATKPPAPP